MRRAVLLALPLVLLAACGEPSTLSADDQALCAQQEDRLERGRAVLAELVEGDRHWSSTGEWLTVSDVLDPAYGWLTSRIPQDAELARLADEGGKAVLSVKIALPDRVFAGDAAAAREALVAVDELAAFCDENG